MAFEPGHNLSKGRPKGSINKETKMIRQWIDTYLSGNIEEFTDKLSKLSPKDYTSTFLSLLEYSVPKLQRTEIKSDAQQQVIVMMQPAPETIDLGDVDTAD